MTLLNACCNLVRESRRQAIYLPGAKVLIRLSDKRDSSRNCKQNRRIKSINPGKRLYGTNSWWDNCEPRVLIDSTSRAVGVGNRACVGRDSSRTRLQGCNLHEGGTLVSTRSSACASIPGPCGRPLYRRRGRLRDGRADGGVGPPRGRSTNPCARRS